MLQPKGFGHFSTLSGACDRYPLGKFNRQKMAQKLIDKAFYEICLLFLFL
jgi:hypothetical protein